MCVNKNIVLLSVLLFILLSLTNTSSIFSSELAPAPVYLYDEAQLKKADAVPSSFDKKTLSVNPDDRQSVVDFYNAEYLSYNSVPSGWTGDIASCSEGTTSSEYEQATLRRINYFRNMTGLPSIENFDNSLDPKCAKAALMMIAEGALSHDPPTTFECYTDDGHEAAGKSNLALGSHGYDSISLYIDDFGAGNEPLGHRRWVLYPRLSQCGTGSTTGKNGYYTGSNDLWVIGTIASRPSSPVFVAWPPAGYVPYQLAYARWSFSVNKDAASVGFAAADVTMTKDGNPVTLSVISKTSTGYGDDTIVWTPTGLPASSPSEDVVYNVTVSNVNVSGASKDYTYTVRLFDPARFPAVTPTPSPTPSPTPTPVPTPEDNDVGVVLY